MTFMQKLTLALSIVLGGAITLLVFTFVQNGRITDQYEKTRSELTKELSEKSDCLNIKDSLELENANLAKFETLTKAMIHRKEVTTQLKYQVGDIVMLKSDSSTVVIEDVLIGGGKYNYYVKYRVLSRDNVSKEVIPELIF